MIKNGLRNNILKRFINKRNTGRQQITLYGNLDGSSREEN